jgi:hypothetical protein
MTDLRVTLKYGPTQDQHRSQGNACRARMSPDPEGVTLQIRHEREYMSAWLSFEDEHLRLPMLSAKPRRRAGHNKSENVTADVSDGTSARLINARFGPLLRTLKSDIWRGPRGATSGCGQAQQTAPLFDHSIT